MKPTKACRGRLCRVLKEEAIVEAKQKSMLAKDVKQSNKLVKCSRSHIMNGCEISFVLIAASAKELVLNEKEWLRG